MPILKTSCCGCTLKHGTLIIGNIMLIGSLLGLCSSAFGYASRNEKIAAIVSACFQVTLSAMLLIGTTKGNRWLLLSWIILEIVGTIICAAIFIILVSDHLAGLDNEKRATFIIIIVVTSFPVFGLAIYLLVIVISHYQELKLLEMEERNNLLPMHSTTNQTTSYSSAVTASPNTPHKEEQ